MGKNINKVDHNAHLFPMAFFWRRTLFVAVTVFLFDWPSMQMAAHHVITVIMMVIPFMIIIMATIIIMTVLRVVHGRVAPTCATTLPVTAARADTQRQDTQTHA